jgi:hypothetical protein
MGEGTTNKITRQLLHEVCARGKVRQCSLPLSDDLFEWLLQHAVPYRGTFNHSNPYRWIHSHNSLTSCRVIEQHQNSQSKEGIANSFVGYPAVRYRRKDGTGFR